MAVTKEYIAYLRSDAWQKLRSKRLAIDEFRCQRCGSPYGLDVHHLRYPEVLGTEDPYTDLITLCRPCHENVERNKVAFREARNAKQENQKREYERHQELLRHFCQERAYRDLSNVGSGKKDYCNRDVVKTELFPFLRRNGDYEGGTEFVISYFRDRRYEIILRMMEEGIGPLEIYQKTGFSRKMVNKVTDAPDKARAILAMNNKRTEEDVL